MLLKVSVADRTVHHLSLHRPALTGPRASAPTAFNVWSEILSRLQEFCEGSDSRSEGCQLRPRECLLLGVKSVGFPCKAGTSASPRSTQVCMDRRRICVKCKRSASVLAAQKPVSMPKRRRSPQTRFRRKVDRRKTLTVHLPRDDVVDACFGRAVCVCGGFMPAHFANSGLLVLDREGTTKSGERRTS